MSSRPELRLLSGNMSNFPNMDTTISAWCSWMLAQSWSQRTVKDRAYLISRVARDSATSPEALTREHIINFLSRPDITATTRQTYFATIRTWHGWLVATGIRDDDPTEDLRRPRAGRQAVRTLRTAHIEHLLSQRLRARTRTMILLMAYQGLRCFEVAKICGRDFDLISRELVVTGKGGVRDVLPIHEVIAEEALKHGQGWWFPQYVPNAQTEVGGHILPGSVVRIVGDAMRRAGVPGTAHSLRHWHATELLRAGVDTRVTQQLMRHASMATTERYLHVDDSQRRAAIDKLPAISHRVTAAAILSATSSEEAA